MKNEEFAAALDFFNFSIRSTFFTPHPTHSHLLLLIARLLLLYTNPVSVYPSAIGLGISVDGDEAELGTNPLALLHLVLTATRRELLAVPAPGEADKGLAAVSRTGLGIADAQPQVDVLVDAGLLVYFVLGGRLQCGYQLFLLGLAAVGILTGQNYQFELPSLAAYHQCLIVVTHHDNAAHLAVGL